MDQPSSTSIVSQLFEMLPLVSEHHARTSPVYQVLDRVARQELRPLFESSQPVAQEVPPFGALTFPYHPMGAVDTLDLFGLDELIIFSYYWANRSRYANVLDIGANLGLHSVILSRCGYAVRCFEPDPIHYALLQENLASNGVPTVEANNAAVSSEAGTLEFVRVLGNTTGSHLAGSKTDPYGELERFPVPVASIHDLVGWADLIKMDVEGHERDILLSLSKEEWASVDVLVEVGTPENARAIYERLSILGVGMFSQKCGWRRVDSMEGIPLTYKEGTLFISSKPTMPWTESPAT